MAGIKIKNKLKAGEKITGQVSEVFEKSVVFILKNDSKVKLPVPEEVSEVINENYDDEIITLSVDSEGEYEIEEHEDWPKSEK